MGKRNIDYPKFVDKGKIKVENFGYDNKNYRFLLSVPFNEKGKNYLRVIMKNPSDANEQICDMTMRKVCNAAYFVGYDGVLIMNLFPYRSKYAEDVYKKFIKVDNEVYNKAMSKNIEVIRENCLGCDVVFAWGTNTICKNKNFDSVYDELAKDVMEIVKSCSKSARIPCYNKDKKYPTHALRWRTDVLANDVGCYL